MQVTGVLGQGLVDPDTPAVYADDLGFTRGDGCFEGCRVIHGTVDKIELHVARIHRSAAALGLEFDEPAWRELIAEATAVWPAEVEGSMRWFLTRGRPGGSPTGIVAIGELPEYMPAQRRDGIRVVTVSRGVTYDAFAGAPWLLGGVKTISYAVNMAAQREAVRRGADDVILLSVDGRLLEAPTSSVIWTVGTTMYTPPPGGGNGILGSTTQLRLFERAAEAGWQTVYTDDGVVDDLHAADAVFLAGSVRGPVDVIELDGRPHRRDVELVRTVQKLSGF